MAMNVIAIQQALEASHSGKWDEAIKILRRALRWAKRDERDVLKRQLAQCLSGRAAEKAEKATSTIRSVARVRQEVCSQAIDSLVAGQLTEEAREKYRKLIDAAADPSGTSWKYALISHIVHATPVVLVVVAILVGLRMTIGSETLKSVAEIVFIGFFIISMLWTLGAQFFGWIGSSLSNMSAIVTGAQYMGRGYRPSCQLCSDEAAYQFETEKHGTVTLCEKHAARLRSVLEYSPGLSRSERARLVSARRDLQRAVRLAPGVDEIRQNLQAVESLLSDFKAK